LEFCQNPGTLNDMTPTDIATAYFDSWRAKDFGAFRALLAEDATFDGPLATIEGADKLVAGIEGMSKITTDIVVERMVADGSDVLTWFALHTSVAPPTPVANWIHVEDGLIARVRVTFDPRPIVGS
jgi:ketosteroid isomerase-like protein